MNGFPFASYLTACVFAIAVITTIVGAIIAVSTTRIIRSVCGLAICCFGLAGLYYFLHSPFLTLMEILIYVGAICVTIIFAVMLAEPEEAPRTESPAATLLWGGSALLLSLAMFGGLTFLGLNHKWTIQPGRENTDTIQDLKRIGVSLLTTYGLAFEIISLVLLVAIFGALVVARYGRTKP
jgi:NADH-quinone oxidoreductase subunit J